MIGHLIGVGVSLLVDVNAPKTTRRRHRQQPPICSSAGRDPKLPAGFNARNDAKDQHRRRRRESRDGQPLVRVVHPSGWTGDDVRPT
jgi:hypothetical protein